MSGGWTIVSQAAKLACSQPSPLCCVPAASCVRVGAQLHKRLHNLQEPPPHWENTLHLPATKWREIATGRAPADDPSPQRGASLKRPWPCTRRPALLALRAHGPPPPARAGQRRAAASPAPCSQPAHRSGWCMGIRRQAVQHRFFVELISRIQAGTVLGRAGVYELRIAGRGGAGYLDRSASLQKRLNYRYLLDEGARSAPSQAAL